MTISFKDIWEGESIIKLAKAVWNIIEIDYDPDNHSIMIPVSNKEHVRDDSFDFFIYAGERGLVCNIKKTESKMTFYVTEELVELVLLSRI